MNLDQITTKCWILALFIRDDGERLLLGDGWFDFKDSLQHFQPNSIANDIVELQGTDGQLLAGQVRRSASQSFDGYVGDALTSKTEIENRRRQFIQFFRTRRHYKVIYIFPDGTAIQRRMGYLTDAPSVPEMWQKFPEYHVALNFEDVNYYEYAEDAQGDEIYAHDSLVKLISVQSGGLVWDEYGAVSHGYTWLDPQTVTGDYITVTDGATGSPLTLSQLTGNATQTTYTGKNLFDISKVLTNGTSVINNGNGTLTITTPSASSSVGATTPNKLSDYCPTLQAGDTATFSMTTTGTSKYIYLYGTGANVLWGDRTAKVITQDLLNASVLWYASGVSTTATILDIQVELGNTATAYEPYVGGTASPNPDYPQIINTVTGEQTVKVVGKNLFSTELEQGTIVGADGTHGAVQPERIRTKNKIYVEPTTTYTLNATTENTKDCFVFLYDKEGTFLERISSIWSNLPVTFTTSASTNFVEFCFSNDNQSGNIAPSDLSNIQLELGSTATTYEPYQEQEFEIYLPSDTLDYMIEQGGFTAQGLNTPEQNRIRTKYYIPVEPNTQYTMSVSSWNTSIGSGIPQFSVSYYSTDDYTTPRLSNKDWTAFSTPATFTTPANCHFVRVLFNIGGYLPITPADMTGIKIRGGNLTPIELAKIGNYQDRIYKNDGKWYIEKQVGKYSVSLTGLYTLTGGLKGAICSPANKATPGGYALCDRATKTTGSNIWAGSFYENPANFMFVGTSTDDATTLKDKYDGATLYYALATPTTTEITDETLLSQLNFIASLYEGVNNISIVGTGAQGEMTLNYYAGVDTTGAGYEWEAGEGGGPTIVQVIGVDNAQPIWTVTGPATNPTLTNITTVQTITWNGTVPNGQKLIVDMANQTATLAGANVYEFITGSWLTLRPGANKLTYSAQGADQASRIQWNGVVG